MKILAITEFGGMIMFVNIEFFEHMDTFTASLNNFLLSIGYLVLKVPFYFNLILPLAFLISMLILLMLMIRGNEMIVVRTSGISTISLMKPLAAFSVVPDSIPKMCFFPSTSTPTALRMWWSPKR